MGSIINRIIQFSEVWGILIPLSVIIIYKITASDIKPVVAYVYIAAILNIIAVSFAIYRLLIPEDQQNNVSNVIFYNIHSFARVILFTWYIIHAGFKRPHGLYKALIPLYILFVILDFVFYESILSFSILLPATESIILLFLCVSFFLYTIKDESDTIWIDQPIFLICTGISLYEVINFFIFLFFDVISKTNISFGIITMQIFSISYVALCIFLAVALYRKKKLLVENHKLQQASLIKE